MTDLAALARTVSPTGRDALRHVADHQLVRAVHASELHAAARRALADRRLIDLHPDRAGLPDQVVTVTALGRQVLDHLDGGAP